MMEQRLILERGERMTILCDRCKEKAVRYDSRDKWANIVLSEKGYGELGNYYLCPECYHKFLNFLKGAADE